MTRAWAMLAVAVLLALFGALAPPGRLPRRETPPPPARETTSLAWQRRHCRTDTLSALELGGDRLADVLILQLGDARLYVPADWFARSRRAGDPSTTQGATLSHGTYGVSWMPELDRNDFIPGWNTEPRCLGEIHRLEPYRLRQGQRPEPPLAVLQLDVDRSTTESPNGTMRDLSRTPYAGATLRIRWPAGAVPILPSDPGRDVGDGWRAYGQAPRETRVLDGPTGDDRLFAQYALEGWLLSFRVPPDLKLGVVVSEDMPVARWETYRARATAILRWLETPPARRNNALRLVL